MKTISYSVTSDDLAIEVKEDNNKKIYIAHSLKYPCSGTGNDVREAVKDMKRNISKYKNEVL